MEAKEPKVKPVHMSEDEVRMASEGKSEEIMLEREKKEKK